MSGNVADWGEIRILLRNFHRLLQTRINVTGLSLRDGILGPIGIHIRSRSKLADSPRRCGRRYLPPISSGAFTGESGSIVSLQRLQRKRQNKIQSLLSVNEEPHCSFTEKRRG